METAQFLHLPPLIEGNVLLTKGLSQQTTDLDPSSMKPEEHADFFTQLAIDAEAMEEYLANLSRGHTARPARSHLIPRVLPERSVALCISSIQPLVTSPVLQV